MAPKPSLVTPPVAAEMLQIPLHTLRTWRSRGGGPEFVKLGRSVRYPLAALEKFAGVSLTVPSPDAEAEKATA